MPFTYIKLFNRNLFTRKTHTNVLNRLLPMHGQDEVSNGSGNIRNFYKFGSGFQKSLKEQIAYEFRQNGPYLRTNTHCSRNTSHISLPNEREITQSPKNKWMDFAKNDRESVNGSYGIHTNIYYTSISTLWNSLKPPFSTSVRNISTLKRRVFKIKKHKKKKRKKRLSKIGSVPWKPSSGHKLPYQLPCKIRRIVKERRRRKKGNRTLRAPRQR